MKKLVCLLMMMCFALPACAQELAYIEIPEGASLPDERALQVAYPTHITLGEFDFSPEEMLKTLLGEDYDLLEQGSITGSTVYRSAGGEDPWEYRRISIDEARREFWYNDPWIIGERGGEYQAPPMNRLPSKSIEDCRELLEGILPQQWLDTPDQLNLLRDRWAYEDRWMTDEEYAAFTGQQKSHRLAFYQASEAGLPILGSFVTATIGADGLASLTICRRQAAESEETSLPLPLDEALTLANSTRSAPCYLIAARLAYSNWLTGSDQYNLCWQLFTDKGTYIVDCVLKKHMCDSYEY